MNRRFCGIDRWLRSPNSTRHTILIGLTGVAVGIVFLRWIIPSEAKRTFAEVKPSFAVASEFYSRFDKNVRGAGKVALTLRLPPRVREGAGVPIKATLTNSSRDSVAVLRPGDGSWDDIDVTPQLELQFRATEKSEWRTAEPDALRCGNATMPDEGDIRQLAAGESLLIEHFLDYQAAGRYQVRLLYINDPNTVRFDWPEQYMAPIRQSTPCNVVSNPVDLEILPARK
jgi:hypothetical protein